MSAAVLKKPLKTKKKKRKYDLAKRVYGLEVGVAAMTAQICELSEEIRALRTYVEKQSD